MRAIIVTLALAFAWAGCTAEQTDSAVGQEQQELTAQKTWTRLYTRAPAKLRTLLAAQGLDVTGSHRRKGYVDVLSTGDELARAKLRYEDRIDHLARLDLSRAARNIADYPTPDQVLLAMDQVVLAYPQIARKVELASGLAEGGIIYAMKISDNVDQDEDEPTFLMDARTHAREVMSTEVAMDAIDYLTGAYGSDPDVTRWVDEMEIWIVPLVNPDGARHAHNVDSWWRKNRSRDCAEGIGVDNNRNYEWNYRQCSGSSDRCDDETYHGPGPASEIETQTMQDLQEELRPLYFLTYHSYGEMIIWPSACERLDEDELLGSIAQELNQRMETDDGQAGQWETGIAGDIIGTAPGGGEDHAYGAAGAMAYTIELNSTGFQPDYHTWRNVTVQRQRPGWQYLLEQTVSGPAVGGHTFDAQTLQPVQAQWVFANHPFQFGQWPLVADGAGRYGRVCQPNSEQVLVFTAQGYLPETRVVNVLNGPVMNEVPMTAGTNHAPQMVLGPDQLVDEGDTVVLDANGSSDPDGNTLFYIWQQTAGPQVVLNQTWSASPSFFAPSVDGDSDLTFEAVASDGELQSSSARVSITVQDVWNSTTQFDSTDTPLSIPDEDPQGITSVIHVSEDRAILKAAVHLDISHTWIGDLRITLTSPSGTQVVLHDHEGGEQDDLVADYEPLEFVGQLSGGDWTLHMVDLGPQDLGTLNTWSLALDLVGDSNCDSDQDCDLPQVSQAICQAGQCQIVQCQSGWRDCNSLIRDGCEVDSDSDLDHCGACFSPCQFPGAQALCQSGQCSMGDCTTGLGNCNGQMADGCESDLESHVQNCGGCGQSCDPAQGQGQCLAGQCQVSSCAEGYDDCNDLALDGCEVDLNSAAEHCGACQVTCIIEHASASCSAGACTLAACDDLFGDCNDDPGDGCETDLSDNDAHCGQCHSPCTLNQAQASCSQGQCSLTACEPGYGNCNSNEEDGCEQDLGSSSQHCGGCGLVCDLPNSHSSCIAGDCYLESCQSGYANCNDQAQDGCETRVQDDSKNCGGCGNVCAQDEQCQQGTCQAACADEDQDGYPAIQCGGSDCDDTSSTVFPGALEVCNSRDDDCDGQTDEDLNCTDQSCDCSTSKGPGPGGLLLFSAVLGLLRRRRQGECP